MIRIQLFLILAVSLSIFSGCGTDDRWKSKRPATVPAQGVVTYKNQPLSGAIVVFQPSVPEGVGASALTDQTGAFDLKAFPPDPGAVPGSYTVMILRMDDADNRPTSEGGDDAPAVLQKSLIPAKYGNPAQSGLKAEVPQAGTDSLRFDLQG